MVHVARLVAELFGWVLIAMFAALAITAVVSYVHDFIRAPGRFAWYDRDERMWNRSWRRREKQQPAE